MTEAIEYLLKGQNDLEFTKEFLTKPGVKSAILQAIIDAAGEPYSEDKICKYRERLSQARDLKPKSDLPSNSHTDGAQRIIYEHVLSLNG
jgi:hypothetical protein